MIMNKQPEVTEATKQAFIDAYFKLRKQKRLSEITIKDITNITGNNRSTFYRYFENIYMLNDVFLDYVYCMFGKEILSNMKNLNDIEAFSIGFINLYNNWRDYIEIIFSDVNDIRIGSKLSNTIKKQFMKSSNLNSNLLDYYGNAYVTMIISTLGHWVQHKDIPLKEVAEVIFHLINNGFNEFLKQ